MVHNNNHLYAIRESNGKRVYVDDVPNGNACGCICSKCEEPLQARNEGKIIDSYFAHQSESDCKGETLAHIEGKEIIKKKKYLYVPDLYGFLTRINFDEVEVEQLIGKSKYRADLICMKGDKSIIVEIVVCSKIDYKKRKYLIENRINTLEITIQLFDNNSIPKNFSKS